MKMWLALTENGGDITDLGVSRWSKTIVRAGPRSRETNERLTFPFHHRVDNARIIPRKLRVQAAPSLSIGEVSILHLVTVLEFSNPPPQNRFKKSYYEFTLYFRGSSRNDCSCADCSEVLDSRAPVRKYYSSARQA